MTHDATPEPSRADLEALVLDVRRLVDEVQTVVVGQDDVIRGAVTCLLAGGHGLLEGVPGLGKTLLVRTLAEATSLEFSRIQFTPDLMPADIVGTSVLVEGEGGGLGRTLQYQPGPVFANIVLADEINRATPKTQSALLEAMAEGQVTAAGKTRALPSPFLVLATQNPLEQEGTYPLPEAQLDRFLFKIEVAFPAEDELVAILDRTTGSARQRAHAVMDAPRLLALQRMVRAMPIAPSLTRYVVRLLRATHPDDARASAGIKRFVRFGGSPRGAQALLLAARIRCAMDGRVSPSIDDVRAVAFPALRHRVLLNFEGEAEGIRVDDLLREIVKSVVAD
jgi:MoxR-like ATPase